MTYLHIGDVPEQWASGEIISVLERYSIALLRRGGCVCEFPLLRQSRNEDQSFNGGPRCKICDVQVILDAPTPGQVKERKQAQHRANKELFRMHPDLRDNPFFAGLDECYPDCGCEGEAHE